ncbi:TonB-linked SusC/RagA family outer membrane protein [Algoriphagus ratkowskyi]|uniref:TonB-linked SusC/RagA family outer membrane protein n=2 Tax=Algoriphagus ratkowskyi TaxID=57028 RepID=A0A2W7SKJ6_9BACT|nr:TonB-dependent receptor [Algoriphagus ratkowskyi]PZX51252.1 TonB-linked SusC/RagA family outer membrane protein [Algoriphagus ratkowskyi]
MKKNIRGQLIMLSKRLLYGFILQLIFCTVLLANTGNAQRKNIEKISIGMSVENTPLEKVFKDIEKKTGLAFTYNTGNVDVKQKVTLAVQNKTVYDLLSDLSKDTGLRFIQINDNIHVRPYQSGTTKGVSIEDANAIEVTGKVIDQSGIGIPGVTIIVEGTTKGTVTDIDGNYSVAAEEGSVLVFSFIGYKNQKVSIQNQSTVNVTLLEDEKALDEIVVVGYGEQKKADVIGAVSQLSSKNIENRQVTNTSSILTGQVPGVTVIQRGGRPGASGGTINIRGVGSFGAGTNPLILIDGIPTNSFNDINPNDIESISVLKDASSAAIYGARAANGVILVTTKTGGSEKVQITYNGYVGFQRATEYPEFVNSWEFAELYNEADGNQVYSEADIQKYRDGSDLDNYPNSDFIGQILTETPVQTSSNFTINGGSKTSKYNLSFGYLYQDGLVIKNDYSRYNVRLNMENDLSSKLKLTSRVSLINSVTNEPSAPATLDITDMLGIIGQSIRFPSIYADRYSNGDYGLGVVGKGTPVSYLNNDSFFKAKNIDINTNLKLDYQLAKSFKISLIGAYNQTSSDDKRLLATQVLNPNITLGPNELSINSDNNYYKTIQLVANYDKVFGLHKLSVLGGYSYEDNLYEYTYAYRNNLANNDLTQLNVGAPDNQKNNGSASEWALMSVFGRIKYDFVEKYLFEATMRYDGSSRFPTDEKFAFFPSAAVGWRISEEGFLKDKASWLDDLKLKASFGILGNQNIGNYPYQNTLNLGQNYPFGGVINTGVTRNVITDPTLHWESTRTTDVGLDMSLLQGKINFGATYFNRFTYDILNSPSSSVSSIVGFGLSQQNSGELRNSGLELVLDYRHSGNDFNFRAGGNLTIINNEVIDLGVGNIDQPNGLVGNGSSLFIGHPMNIYYGYQADGLFVDAEDVANWAEMKSINPNTKPGDIRYKDISGPDGVPDGIVNATYDRTVLGSQIPKFNFGLNLGADFKGFDFSMLIQGVAGVKGNLSGDAGYAFNNQGGVQKWQMEERWTTENPDRNAGYPRLEFISNSGTPNTLLSSFWTLDGSYVKLRNVQLGYSLPQPALEKLKISRLRMYVSAENIFTYSNYRKGWDPEVNTARAYYPILGNYTFGVNLQF